MKKTLLLFMGLSLLHMLNAQQIPSVLASGGTSNHGATISLDWTLGELAIQTLSTPGQQLLTEGFHQPILPVEKVANVQTKVLPDQFQVTVAPNPVRSILSIKIKSDLEGRGIIDLWDSFGRHLKQAKASLQQEDLELNMSSLPAAVYSLTFRSEKGELLRVVKVTRID